MNNATYFEYQVSFKCISVDFTSNTRLLPLCFHYIADDCNLLCLDRLQSRPSFLQPVSPTYHTISILPLRTTQYRSCSYPILSPAFFQLVFQFIFNFYARVPKFLCSVELLTVSVCLSAECCCLVAVWSFFAQQILSPPPRKGDICPSPYHLLVVFKFAPCFMQYHFIPSQCSRVRTSVFLRSVLVPPIVTTICSLISDNRLCPRMSVDLVLIKQHEAPYFCPAYCYMQPSSITSSISVFMSITPTSAVQPAIRSTVSVTGWFLLHTVLDPSPVFFCSSQNLLSRCLFQYHSRLPRWLSSQEFSPLSFSISAILHPPFPTPSPITQISGPCNILHSRKIS